MALRRSADATESGRSPLASHWPSLVLGLMVAMYVAYFGWLTLRAYDHFVYQAYDLGIYDQAIWNTVHGRPFRSTLEEPYDNLLGDHFEPILLPVALIYALWESPKALLLIQTIALALGAVPVYLLARDSVGRARTRERSGNAEVPTHEVSTAILSHELVALGFALVYLLYPPVHSANVFEFHPSALALPLLLSTVLFLRRRRYGAYFVLLVLTMSTKEVLPLTTLALGLNALLFERQRVVGLVTMAVSALWFVLAVFAVIPYFSPEGQSQYFAEYYGWLGDTPGTAIAQMLGHPEAVWQRLIEVDSLQYIERLLRPWVYTPLLGLPILLVAAPALLLNLLSDFSFQLRSLNFFQYAAAIAPFVVVAAIDGTALLSRSVGSLLDRRSASSGRRLDTRLAVAGMVVALSLVVSLSIQRYHGFLPFSLDFYLAPRNEKVLAAECLLQQVPAEGTVSADLIFGPHLSQRPDLYLYPSVRDADYVVVDASYRNAPFPPRDRYGAIQAMLRDGEYGVVDGNHGYLLLQRGLTSQTIPEEFYGFARVTEPEPQYRTDVAFGDELRLVGFDLVWERPVRPHAYLVLYWEALRPLERDLRLFFVLTDPSGEIVPGTDMEFDASVWYPPSRWAEGEVIRTATLPWSLEDPARFGVAVGVVEGPGFWELDRRLEPTIGSSLWPMPQVHDGSLVWLATLVADGRLATLEKPGEPP